MKKSSTEEDFEREPQKDSIYLYEKECEQWLWWHEQWRMQEGDVIIEGAGVEEEELLVF